MSARVDASRVVYLQSVVDEAFLRNAVETLERLKTESELRGHELLASLLAITKGEAEDSLKTHAKDLRVLARQEDPNDGAAKMARKFACRAGGRG